MRHIGFFVDVPIVDLEQQKKLMTFHDIEGDSSKKIS